MARHSDLGIGNRQEDAVDERMGDEHAEQDHRRQHQAGGQPALVLEQAGDRSALRRGDVLLPPKRNRCSGPDGRHQPFLPTNPLAAATHVATVEFSIDKH